LRKIHAEIYDRGGEAEVRKFNISELAKMEHDHYEKRRQLKI